MRCSFLALGGVGVGLTVWATRLMPRFRDETHPRRHERTRDRAGDGCRRRRHGIGGVEEIRRRRFLLRLLVGAAGALGLAALIPIRSLGSAPGSSLFTTQWTEGARLVVDGTARR